MTFSCSGFAVIEQDETDEDQANGPNPARDATLSSAQAKFQPAGGPCQHSADGESGVADFREKFFFDIAERMAVRQ